MRRTALLAALTIAACGGPVPSGAGPPSTTPDVPPTTASPRPSRDVFMEPSRPPPEFHQGDLERLQVVDGQIAELRALGRESEAASMYEARGSLLERMGRLSEAVSSYEHAATLYLEQTPPLPARATAARAEAGRIRARIPQQRDAPDETAP